MRRALLPSLWLAAALALGACSSAGPTACQALTCAEGCCDSDGVCVKPAAQGDARCGGGGGMCGACSAGQTCSPGVGCAAPSDGGP